MPGIVGLVTKMSSDRAEAELHRMLQPLLHQPFYSTGTWVDESLGVYLGWAVRKNSFSDGMPLWNERRDVTLVFSGEEFPEPDTIYKLKARGHDVEPEGASYLVHLAEEDSSFPAGLNGRFHGLLANRTRGTATLFNDCYGMHRLYFYESNDAFYFAAEAKAILAARPELRSADAQSLGEFVAFGCILENRTLFKGIHALPSGSAWVFRDGSVEQKKRYFDPREWEEQSDLEPEAYYQEIRDVFARNLPRYFKGRERIGMSLTGGLDTRIIMAWHKPPPNSLPCYTFGGMFRECQDVSLARNVAKICEQPHSVIEIGDEFLSRFPFYAERSTYITEGSVDLSRSPDLFVNENAREIAPVRIAGTYGSEILRQLAMFKPVDSMPGLFQPELLNYAERARCTYAAVRREHPVTFAAFLQSPWYHHGVLALEETHLTVRSPYLDRDFVRTVYRAPKPTAMNDDVRLRLIWDGNPTLGRIPTDRGVGGDSGHFSSAVFRGLLEFTFKAEYAYDYGMPQWLAQIDSLLSPFHIERCFLGRHKLFHFRVWYRDALSEYVRQVLLDPRTLSRPYLERTGVEAVVRDHLRGHRNYTTEIHKLLTLELLHRLFLDSR